MKVVKYHLKAKVQAGGKEEVKESTFRHLANARKYMKETAEKLGAKCSKLNVAEDTYTMQCEGNSVKVFFEVKKERIKRVKKETEKKEEKKQEEKKSEQKIVENKEQSS
ncbi:MAG: hypothetical protein TQ35_0007795 [Candidatus Aramenus sulfurataquae]|jgi:hypothetical protein|uniref:Uncharacterized protein n=2 Tax=Candidatus Aramenus sulfurataquae TaxID=1326980 RepID=A0A0F2LKS4_9CREN|nr:hypothetical protein [Candidatus Aramenus sulfurataquae]